MSKVYFTSDWHLDHKNIPKYREEFKTTEENNIHFINEFNRIVKKNDIVFFLGDIAFEESSLELLKKLRHCRKKILFLGNHDYVSTDKLLEVFDEVRGFMSYKNFWISHCPIHPQELRNRRGNIHGHLHTQVLDDGRYFDVSPDKNNMSLVDFEIIKEYFDGV